MKVVVHVDGGARGNPGPAAAGAVISTPDGEVIADAAEAIGVATNNVAEYRGLLLGLRKARELGASEVEVVNDSELVAKQVNGDLQGQASRHEAAARAGAAGARASSSAGASARCRERRTRAPTRSSTRRWTRPRISALTQRPALAALGGAIAIAFSAILVDLANVTPSTAAIFRCAYALPLLGLLALGERRRLGPPPQHHWRYGAVAGAFFAADLILWHHAIADVGAGLATTLANLQVVMVALAAWALLGEQPSARIAVAVPLVFGGAVLISGVIGEGAYGDDPRAARSSACSRRSPTRASSSSCARWDATCAGRPARCSPRRSRRRSSRPPSAPARRGGLRPGLAVARLAASPSD